MANLKNLIGKALNKAKSSKPSDDGYKTRVVKKGMTPKQGMEYKSKETSESIKKGFNIINENKVKASRPGFNPNVPASAKTTKPAPIQAAKEKRDKIQATFNNPYRKGDVMGSRGGTGMKTEFSPARKEYNAREVKELTQPGGLKKKLTQFETSKGRSRQEKFQND
jgi:hypothetical protein